MFAAIVPTVSPIASPIGCQRLTGLYSVPSTFAIALLHRLAGLIVSSQAPTYFPAVAPASTI
jgi:hypothetical protein